MRIGATAISLRTKFVAYLASLHLVLGVAAIFILINHPYFLFVVEAIFIASVVLALRLVRELFVPLDLINTGADLIAERDFTSRFTEVGQPEMDRLIDIYNSMIDRLREERLTAQEQHELLQRIVAASPSGILICDFDGRIAQMNPAAEHLATPEILREITAIPVGESRLVSGVAPQRLKVWRAEFRDRGFSKSFFVIEELTDELRLSEKSAYEKLIRMMSHEVNNSVGSVRSLLESVTRYAPQLRDEDRDDFTRAVEVASARIDALNRFMKSFADVVRIPPPRRAPARIAELIRPIATLLAPELRERNIALQLDLDDTVKDVDVHQFEQALINILRNAVDAVDRDGTVLVHLVAGQLSVDDSGPGIDPVVGRDLFTPFFTTKREGRGLGLTIVQEILTSHGFSFSLTNRKEGGARFVVRM